MYKRQAYILVTLDGNDQDEIFQRAETLAEIGDELGAFNTLVLSHPDDKRAVWAARSAFLTVIEADTEHLDEMDVVVPVDKVAEFLEHVHQIGEKYGVGIRSFGHAGDGNLHPTFLCDKRDKEEFARVEAAVDEMFDVAISLHGTLSGEHGIGTAKSKWMEKETSRGTILFSQRLRRALDPKGLLNPTKLVGI